jgi:XTP/dITP diphosphohydrolase
MAPEPPPAPLPSDRLRPAAASRRGRPAIPGVRAGGPPLAFVTGNAGKLAELRDLLAPRGIEVVGDGRGYPEIQAGTLAEVTEAGANHLLASGLKPPFLLEDSGLFVSALRGFPGVFSRHALETIGCRGVLDLLRGVEPEVRGASFAADLTLVEADGSRRHFEGSCKGRIAERAAGSGGFGFDPIFIPDGQARTFAEMGPGEKSRFSHRGQAVRALAAYLSQTASP